MPSILPVEIVVVSLLAVGATAQGQSAGMFPGIPAAMTLRGSSTAGPSQIVMKGHGFQTTAPGVDPQFDLQAILASHGAPVGTEVDDFSLGLDWILADDQTGAIQVSANRWAAITFSVTNASRGAAGSRIAAETTATGGAGADVFSYVLPGSVLPPEFVGAAHVERVSDSNESGLGRMPPEVTGLDHFLPLYQLDPSILATLPPVVTIYFTLTSQSAMQPQVASWFANTPPSGATILATTQTRTGGWSAPRVFMTFRDLGLVQGDDVDGLAIDLDNQRILFSLRGGSLDQIMFLYYGTDVAVPVPYTEPNNTPVSTSIGVLQNDDVDAICSMDPSIRSRGNQLNPMFFFMGTPRPQALPPTPAIAATAFRDYLGGNIYMTTYMVGFPPAAGPAPGLAAVFLTFGNTLSPLYPLGPALLRNPTPIWTGDPKRLALPVPAALSLSAAVITFRWFTADAATLELAEAWPVQVRL